MEKSGKEPRLILRTRRAANDLHDIWTYIAEDDPASADHMLDRIETRCRQLALFPYFGSKRKDLAPGLRGTTVGNYRIFYRVTAASIEIIRVIHAARDISAEYFE